MVVMESIFKNESLKQLKGRTGEQSSPVVQCHLIALKLILQYCSHTPQFSDTRNRQHGVSISRCSSDPPCAFLPWL